MKQHRYVRLAPFLCAILYATTSALSATDEEILRQDVDELEQVFRLEKNISTYYSLHKEHVSLWKKHLMVNADAQLLQSISLSLGTLDEYDLKQSAELLQKAADSHHELATYALTIQQIHGAGGVLKDLNKAQESITQKLSEGNDRYLMAMANLEIQRMQKPEDMENAWPWIQKAADKLIPAGLRWQSRRVIQQGHHSKESLLNGRKLLEAAANQGDPVAMLELSQWFSNYGNADDNRLMVIKWLEQAAATGDEIALIRKAEYKSYGKFYAQNKEESRKIIAGLEQSNCAQTLAIISAKYAHGFTGIAPQVDKAIELAKRASAYGDPWGQCAMAFLLSNAQFGPVDLPRALKLYEQAASRGNESAMYEIGLFYRYGKGVERSEEAAINWFFRAAARGHADALNSIGLRYYDGRGGLPKDRALAFTYYVQAATNGNVDAMMNLSALYLIGELVPRDINAGLDWLDIAIRCDSPRAMVQMAKYLYTGEYGLTKNPMRADALLKQAAQYNDPQAMLEVGRLYYTGVIGGKPDFVSAANWFHGAINNGSAEACVNLGLMYNDGVGVEKDASEAFRLFKQSVDGGHAMGYRPLALCYFNGNGVPKDDQKGLEALDEGIKLGNTYCMADRGYYYIHGTGGKKDIQLGRKLLEEAASRGCTYACYRLACEYYTGEFLTKDENASLKWTEQGANDPYDPSIQCMVMLAKTYQAKENYNDASRWYRKAADLDDAEAQNNLGTMYQHGKGVMQNYETARKYYLRAAANRFGMAYRNLAWMSEHGVGTQQDLKQCVEYLRLGAEMKDPPCMTMYGEHLMTGIGVTIDAKSGIEWVKKGAASGDVRANLVLGVTLAQGQLVPKDAKQALDWLNKGMDLKEPHSFFVMGLIYYSGDCGMTVDKPKAIELFQKSANLGDPDALYNLGIFHTKGDTVPVDQAKAVEYFQKAARAGHPKAQELLKKNNLKW